MFLYLGFNLSLYGKSFEYKNNPIITTLSNKYNMSFILKFFGGEDYFEFMKGKM